MADILKGLTGSAGTFVFTWLFACALAISTFAVFLMPSLLWIPSDWQLSKMDFGKATLILAFASVGLGLFMSGIETLLYRALEGYAWPKRLRRRGVRRERKRLEALIGRLKLLQHAGSSDIGWEAALLEEKLARFPANPQDVAPSRLGNAFRAFETYGMTTYHLDSQLLWSQLFSTVSDAVRKEVDQSRAAVDFLIALVYLSAAYGVLAVAGLYSRGSFGVDLFLRNWDLVATAVVSCFLSWFLYRASVVASTYSSSTHRALIDLGRVPLAQAMGLRFPQTLEEERSMWQAVAQFHDHPTDAAAAHALNAFRTT